MEDLNKDNMPKHIAIIADGNRRWARSKGLKTRDGHKAGADALERVSKFCNKIGIQYLTIYAFSTENWKRSKEEISGLMAILRAEVNSFLKQKDKQNIKIKLLGDISKLSDTLQKSINRAIEMTKNNTGLTLNIAFNYGGRAEITKAMREIAKDVKKDKLDIQDINEELISNHLYTKDQPDPDLLIRTSGELRTSNFLPWQIAYTEFYFPNKNWPEFDKEDILDAIKVYQSRNRRFGGRP